MARRYYVVQTNIGREEIAKINLLNQSFNVFLPTCILEKEINPRYPWRAGSNEKPLFPTYLFVEFDVVRDPWRSINGTRGVRCILGEGEKPVPVEHGFVEELYTRWDGGEFKEKPVDLARVHAGDYARVNSGSFAGLVGRCLEARATKIKLSLNVFGGAVAVTFNSGAVVPVAA